MPSGRKLELTGDGRDDYIVAFRDTVCPDREAAYCCTGCIMDILTECGGLAGWKKAGLEGIFAG